MKSIVAQMAVYEAYHRNPWNKVTHLFGIPIIVFSILIPPGWLRIPVGPITVTGALLVVGAALVYYYLLDVSLAAGMTLVLSCLLLAADAVSRLPLQTGLTVFVGAFVGGWILQFIGHSVFEKRKPAFTDNAFQLVIGPIYILAEGYFLLGIKRSLQSEVRRLDAASDK
jgi:uncharacterized membrane protein YGL010W